MIDRAYILDARGVYTGLVHDIADPRDPLPIGAYVTDQVPPTPSGSDVVLRGSNGGWRTGPEPKWPSPPASPPPIPKKYTREQFFALFTDAEIFAWRNAVKKANAATNPNAAQKGLIAMEVRTGTVEKFDMANARTLAGFDLLVALGVLTQTRADEIKAL